MITILCGGTGAGKFLHGLQRAFGGRKASRAITAIVNTGDDLVWWGLHVSPDLDSITYALAGMLNHERGWGVEGDTFECLARIRALGAPGWFALGDRDLATHLYRTGCLREGMTLSEVTAELAAKLRIPTRILPMSNDRVETRVLTEIGELSFQEYFVRERYAVRVGSVRFVGATEARPAPGVLPAIAEAEAVVLAPSNPITSIGPILAVPGIRQALATTRAPVLAISPIVGNAAVSGPAGDLMRAHGLPVSAVGVAKAYCDFLDVLVMDTQDAALAPQVEATDVRAHVCNTMMRDDATKEALAREVLRVAKHTKFRPRERATRS